MVEKSDLDSGYFVGHKHCIANEFPDKKDFSRCESSDAMAIYEHDGEEEVWYDAYCYRCHQKFYMEEVHRSSVAKDLGVGDSGVVVNRVKMERKPKAIPLTIQEASELIKKYGYKSNNYRSIKDEYSKFFGHLTELDSKGNVVATYYPETCNYKMSGYKRRGHPKVWGSPVGLTGIFNDLSGQVKFKDYNGHRDILIVGGEADKAAAFQMLRENQILKSQKDYAPIAVVSPTTGEGSAFKQIRAQYEFLDRFENIIIGMDNDEAGKEATKKIIEVLPKDKVKVAHWTGKDPNNALILGKERQWLSDYYGAEGVDSTSIIRSRDLQEALIAGLNVDKIPLPGFLWRLQKAMSGGIPPGKMVNVIGETKSGKTSFTNAIIYHWIFNSPVLMGIISLELAKDQYAIALASTHLGKSLQQFETKEEAMEYLSREEIKDKLSSLWINPYGEDNFYLLDERDFNVQATQKMCETLNKKYGCGLVVVDPIHDLIGSLSNEEQQNFLSWEKVFKKDGTILFNVCHTNKSNSGNRGNGNPLRELQEDDVQGTSAIAKSGDCNIFVMRDKYSKCEIIKNTIWIKMVCRWSNYSGWPCKLYFDLNTYTFYDFDDYFDKHPEKLPPGFDRDATPFDKKKDNNKSTPKMNIPATIKDDFVEVGNGVRL